MWLRKIQYEYKKYTIVDFFKSDAISSKTFIGVFTRDQIPAKIGWPCSFIVNTDNIYKNGEHWLAFFLTNLEYEIFYPLRYSPKYHNFENFIKAKCFKYFYNDQRIQGLFSNNYGFFCCLIIYKRNRNLSFKNFLKLFFKDDQYLNDNLIESLKENNFF